MSGAEVERDRPAPASPRPSAAGPPGRRRLQRPRRSFRCRSDPLSHRVRWTCDLLGGGRSGSTWRSCCSCPKRGPAGRRSASAARPGVSILGAVAIVVAVGMALRAADRAVLGHCRGLRFRPRVDRAGGDDRDGGLAAVAQPREEQRPHKRRSPAAEISRIPDGPRGGGRYWWRWRARGSPVPRACLPAGRWSRSVRPCLHRVHGRARWLALPAFAFAFSVVVTAAADVDLHGGCRRSHLPPDTL